MAFIDLLIGRNVQGEIDKLLVELNKVHQRVLDINQLGLNLNRGSGANSTADLQSLIDRFNQLTQAQQRASQQALDLAIREERLSQAQNRSSISTNQLERSNISLEQARERQARAHERELQRLQASQNLYNKTQKQINNITQAYNELAVKKARYGALTDNEEKRLQTLTKTLEKYNALLKGVDANIGRHTRNVGNYASAFNPLNNSINQLSRELPALGNGFQTFTMAISNNIPALFDALKSIRQENRALIEQGQPVRSVFSQLASAIFSWGTALSVATTLLVLYSKQIGEFLFNSESKKKAIEEEKKAIEDKKRVEKEAFDNQVKYGDEEISRSQLLLSTAKNTRLSYEQRIEAVKELQKRYPEYLGNLTQEQILAGKTADAEYRLNDALMKRAIFLSLQDKIKDVTKKLVEVQITSAKEIQKNANTPIYDKIETGLEKVTKKKQKFRLANIEESESLKSQRYYLNLYNEELKKSGMVMDAYGMVQTEKKVSYLEELELLFKLLRAYEPYNNAVNDDKRAKAKKAEKALDLELYDFRASQFEKEKQMSEEEIKMYEEIANNEKVAIDERYKAFEIYTTKKLELEDKSFQESTRLSNLEFEKEKEKLQKTYNEYVSKDNVTKTQRVNARQELNNSITSLEKKHKLDLEVVEIQHSNNVVGISKDTFKKIQELRELYNGVEFNKNQKEKELNDLLEHKNRLANIDRNTTLQQLKDIDKDKKDAERKLQEESLQNDIDVINRKLKNTELTAIEELRLKTELYDKTKALNQLEINDLNEKKKEQEEYLKTLSDTYKGFINDFASSSGFAKTLDLLNGGLDKFKGNVKASTLVISEAFQEMYNTLNAGSTEYFQNELKRNEEQKKIAVEFAGDSATAKEEIERQYEEKRKAIQKRQAEAEKEKAIFNAVINTAQAVVSALPNIPLSILIGIIGAAQIAAISSRPIPEFWKGTESAPEGIAKTQEKGREFIFDKNYNLKSTGSDKGTRFEYLSAGDKVWTAERTRKFIDENKFQGSLNRLLLDNTINPIVFAQNQNNNDNGVINAINGLRSDLLSSNSSLIITRDKRGERVFEQKNGMRRELLNNSLKGVAKYVK